MVGYAKRGLCLLLLMSFGLNLFPMNTTSSSSVASIMSQQEIQELLDSSKASYSSNVATRKLGTVEKKNKKALLKACLSPRIVMIVVTIIGLCIVLPILNSTISMSKEDCQWIPANQTDLIALVIDKKPDSNVQILTNGTAKVCLYEKYGFQSEFTQRMQIMVGGLLAVGLITAASVNWATMNAICPTPAVTLDKDVIGIDKHVMEKIKTHIAVFMNPKAFEELGATLPKAVLFVGPPGTGKTLIARAIAGETKMAFLDAPATSFTSAYGIKVKFEQARKLKPCVLFIDEIDTIGSIDRSVQQTDAVSSSKLRMLNQLLMEIDKPNQQIMIIAATNHPEILDPALRRSGRFDNTIKIPKPNFNSRIKLLLHYIFKLPKIDLNSINTDLLGSMATNSDGFTASDFKNLVNQAALTAGQKRKQKIDASDLQAGLEIIQYNNEMFSKTN